MALKAVLFQAWVRPNVAKVGARTIVSKALREKKDKPAPFPYLEKKYGYIQQMYDKTTLRLDENSKLICVEGAHAIGKSKLAQELADEFEMVYMPPPDMSDIYIHPTYGIDYRQFNDIVPDWFKIMDEKDFVRNPMGIAHGAVDRFMMRNWWLKYRDHIRAVRHILNTGQGVVIEGCPNADYIYMDAAYNAGWIQPETYKAYHSGFQRTCVECLRPNLIIYLDAPVEVVQNNIKKRGNEWDQNSPVWSNKNYLNEIYSGFKTGFLRDIQQWSRVLVYDWSDGGDTEIVIEDIEKTELDLIELYDDQQRDWRFNSEEGAVLQRRVFTMRSKILEKLMAFVTEEHLMCEHLVAGHEDTQRMNDLMKWLKKENYETGWNATDPNAQMKSLFGDIFTGDEYKLFASFKWNQYWQGYEQLNRYEMKHGPQLDHK